ncbi:hypothetical protein GCM10010420_07290 [Streptomyces glaucosporus]|uniref:DUF2637 domain-containing protein n=1 Tax=Streptomyces glaucosporus TaxID=284044 RepID=A0ABP5UTH0_9ACTN
MNRFSKVLLVVGLVAVVAMAFRVSWNALKDVAAAVGADATAALLYPFVVDGLMALALVAALVLPEPDRRFALRVLGAYTAASLVLNYVHGLVPSLHGAEGMVRMADWAPAHWVLVLLATSLPVGSIFFGSDLVAKVLHHPAVRRAPEPVDQAPADEPEVTTEVAVDRADEEPAQERQTYTFDDWNQRWVPSDRKPEERPEVVMPPVAALEFRPIVWPPETTADVPAPVTASVAAEEHRQVVTEVVTLTPAELRKQARKLHREVVRSTGRPVTIDRLREEFGLSRREATELRREIVKENRS